MHPRHELSLSRSTACENMLPCNMVIWFKTYCCTFGIVRIVHRNITIAPLYPATLVSPCLCIAHFDCRWSAIHYMVFILKSQSYTTASFLSLYLSVNVSLLSILLFRNMLCLLIQSYFKVLLSGKN